LGSHIIKKNKLYILLTIYGVIQKFSLGSSYIKYSKFCHQWVT
jgi:hypothetical protein